MTSKFKMSIAFNLKILCIKMNVKKKDFPSKLHLMKIRPKLTFFVTGRDVWKCLLCFQNEILHQKDFLSRTSQLIHIMVKATYSKGERLRIIYIYIYQSKLRNFYAAWVKTAHLKPLPPQITMQLSEVYWKCIYKIILISSLCWK